MVEVEDTLEENSGPEDATLDSFLEDAKKAALEEAGIVEDQLNEQSEAVSETSELVQEETVEDSELDKPFIGSRREAYRLAEERQKLLEEAQAKTAEVYKQLEEQKNLDEELAKEVEKALASEDEYKNLEYRALNGDKQAGTELLQIKANRAFFAKLQGKAQRDITNYFTAQLVNNSKEAGLSEDLVFKGSPADIVKAAYQGGLDKANSEAQIKIESLEAEITRLKTSRVTGRVSQQLTGGSSASGDVMSDLFGEDGLPTDNAIEAARSGRLRSLF